MRPQSWQEKIRMARFVRLGESFLQSSFLDCCVSGGEWVTAEDEQILLTLAVWINRPDEDTAGLPLDTNQLAKVTLEVCRSMSVGPAAIGDLAAPEVESLWRNLDRAPGWDRVEQMQPTQQQFDTKIVVVPDAARVETPATPDTPGAPSSLTLAEVDAHEIQSTEVQRVEPAAWEPELEQTAMPHKDAQRPAALTQPQGRFRASFNTVVLEERRASQVARLAASRKILPSAPTQPKALTEPRASASDAREPFFRGLTEMAPVAVEPSETAMPEWRTLQPAISTVSQDAHHTPTASEAGEPDVLPTFASVPQVALMEALLDEFCQRLDEAAADLGILEEV